MKRRLLSLILGAAVAASAFGTMGTAALADENEVYMFISQPEYADAINELIEAYKEVAPDVTINYETTQNDYPTLLKAKLNSGEVPDIFSSTSGKEIDVYKEWSYDLTGQPLTETMLPSVASAMKSPEDGNGVYGLAIKGNYFGIVYNKAIFEECGITEFPKTTEELKAACEKISEAGYKPFTTGFSEWWVFKHVWQHFLAAAAGDAGVQVSDLVASFEKGEAKVADYPALYNNFFDFIDLAIQYGDDKPLETALENELAAFGSGEAAMVLGQGAWIEADSLAIDPDLQIGFNGYPVSDKADQCKIISGSDQALHVYNESEALQATLDFVNWWYTSDYGINWFTDVAGVVPPVQTEGESSFEIIKQGSELEASEGSAALGICYSTDSWHQVFGELIQSYITGSADKDATCAAIEEQWAAIDGAE
ncbi:MAG: extracellular solute-binding protein [Lachnospiraceae bacterium]|nr:extracellular solute-binding protein [Lachnospiraceae bacterium]